MKANRAALVLAACLILLGTACHDDDGGSMMDPGQGTTVELRHDGDNFNSPNLPAATYGAAARFTSAQTAAVQGGELIEIQFFIQSVPDDCRINVYGPGTSGSPGALLYTADVTSGLSGPDWNTHALQNPVSIPNGDLWIAVEFTHAATLRVIGCDAGPAVTDGDWLYSSADSMWTPFNQRFPGNSVNWNIRAIAKVTM